MTRIILIALLCAILIYGYIEARPLISGPHITLTSPLDGAVLPDGTVTISGVALRTQTLSLDGATLLMDQSGTFSKQLTLPRGSVILVLTATDRFKRVTSVTRTVFVP